MMSFGLSYGSISGLQLHSCKSPASALFGNWNWTGCRITSSHKRQQNTSLCISCLKTWHKMTT